MSSTARHRWLEEAAVSVAKGDIVCHWWWLLDEVERSLPQVVISVTKAGNCYHINIVICL